uniref:Putative PAS-rich protein n=1 Tax=Erysiphe necator associated polymycovirus 4 TaxID=2742558 RepID=A0A8E3YWI1_9VIRU|nr:putative PAS-rich protein [Erysiphe necator associated polymycovirus 4]
MSLSDVISPEVLGRLSALSLEDYEVLASVTSLGYRPGELYLAVSALADGKDVKLPEGGGQPRPLTINAWSFVSDKGQYHDTYGLSSARAGEIKDLLREDREAARAAIVEVVSARLRTRGSNKPLHVSFDGMPGGAGGDKSQSQGRRPGADLKREIAGDSSRYGQYSFVAEDTDRSGAMRFKVPLGAGLWATYQNKTGAIDVARITRVKGRDHPLVVDHVYFWRSGKTPLRGADIPEKIRFNGILAPSAPMPPNPVDKAATVAGDGA